MAAFSPTVDRAARRSSPAALRYVASGTTASRAGSAARSRAGSGSESRLPA